MRMPRGQAWEKRALLNFTGLALIAVLALGFTDEANAYADPNAAGPLFQFLFPLLIAITSLLATCRRMLAQACRRVKTRILGAMRGGGSGADLEEPIDPS